MLNNKKIATVFICVGAVAIVAALIVSALFRKPHVSTDIPPALDEAVTRSIFTRAGVSMSDIEIDGKHYRYAAVPSSREDNFECMGEGHLILGYSDKGGSVEAYALCSTIGYGFRNDMLMDETGSFSIPTVLYFDVSENGAYHFKDAREAEDGSNFASSVNRMFPAEIARQVFLAQSDDAVVEKIHKQCDDYAKAYLKKIGRKAKISTFNEEDFKILTDYGVSVDVSNELLKLRGEYGLYVGNFERIEDGVRYLYSVQWDGDDNGTGKVIYTKKNYDTGKVVEKFIYTVEGDTFTEVKPKKKK